jgi:hypothetical protein
MNELADFIVTAVNVAVLVIPVIVAVGVYAMIRVWFIKRSDR